MNKVLDALVILVMWPLICLGQLFDRIMVNMIATAASLAVVLLLLVTWIHFSPKPDAPLILAVPAIVAAPTPAAAPCQPYFSRC